MISKYEKTNGVKLFALVAVLAMVFAGAAVMMDDGVDAANDTTYISGQVTASQTFEAETNVVVNDNLEIPAGKVLIIEGTFTVNEGSTITIKAGGQLVFQGATAVVNINGNIVAEGKAASEVSIVNNVVYSYNSVTKKVESAVNLNGTITLDKGAILGIHDGNDVAGGTNTIENTSSTNGDLIIGSTGTLDVNKRSSNVSEVKDQNIKMYAGATFTTEGYSSDVTVSGISTSNYYTSGSVTITYSGSKAATNRDTSNLTFTVTTQNISAYTAVSEGSRVTVQQCIVNVDGTLDGQAATSSGTPVAAVNDVLTFNKSTYPTGTTAYYEVDENGDASSTAINPISGSISGTLNVAENGSISFGSTGNYANVIVSGTLDFSSEAKSTTEKDSTNTLTILGKLTVTGTINADWVTGGTTESIVANDKTNGFLIVDGGKITITGMDIEDLYDVFNIQSYAAAYSSKVNNIDTTYICDFAVAVTEATAAESDVYIFGLDDSEVPTKAEDAIKAGAYVIDTNITIPEGMVLYGCFGMVVTEDAALTFASGSDFTNATSSTKIFVLGKVIDEEGIFDSDDSQLDYEVKKLSEDEEVATYTTLAIALDEAQPGENIQLKGEVTISENLTIPAEVTVTADSTGNDPVLTVDDATLTVNGILNMNGKKFVLEDTNADNVYGNIAVNNIVSHVAADDVTAHKLAGAYFTGQIGDDAAGTAYITSAAVAGANSTTTSNIDIYGKLSMGDVTFTEGDNGLTVTVNGEVTAGTVTIVGNGIKFNQAGTAGTDSFTGTVTSDVTAGTASIAFNKACGAEIEITNNDDGTSVTTMMNLDGTIYGAVTVSAGAVNMGNSLVISEYNAANKIKTVLTVTSGATLNMVKNSSITVNAGSDSSKNPAESYDTFVIDGTFVYTDGTFVATGTGPITVNGTMNVEKSLDIDNALNVTGTLAVSENADKDVILTVAKMYVGDDEGAAGTVTGTVNFDATKGVIVVYPAADVSGAMIAIVDGESTADVTAYYINGDLYMTSYTSDAKFQDVVTGDIELVGFEKVAQTAWCSDEAMETAIDTSADLAGITAAYAKAEPSVAYVYLSVGTNMSVFIDDVRYPNGDVIKLDVGQHTIVVQVNPGYTGTTSVLFDGQAVTGGTFEVTPEMADEYKTADNHAVLSVTGEIAVDTGSTDDGGMGLTEILLIILVVLIVVMAIMVALRLMRS